MPRSKKRLFQWLTTKPTARFDLTVSVIIMGLFTLTYIETKNSYRLKTPIDPLSFSLWALAALVGFIAAIRLGIGTIRGYRNYKFWQILVAIANLSVGLILAFSFLYWQESAHANTCMNVSLTKIDSLYFTITTLATVGYGDIYPHSQTCRLIASGQMLGDILLAGIVIALIVARIASSLSQAAKPIDKANND